MSSLISRATTAFVDRIGLNAILRWIHRRHPLILSYHGVCDDNSSLPDDAVPNHIRTSMFSEHLRLLPIWGYRFVTMDQMLDALSGATDPTRLVTLTFDDGFANVVTNAYPIMKVSGAKGCLYVCPGLYRANQLLWTDRVGAALRSCPEPVFRFTFRGADIQYRLGSAALRREARSDITRRIKSLSRPDFEEHLRQFSHVTTDKHLAEHRLADLAQLRSLDPGTLAVGCHTRTHVYCGSLSTSGDFQQELVQPKNELEQDLGSAVRHFCYPFGGFNDTVVRQLQEAGYASAVTVACGSNRCGADPYRLKRIDAGGTVDHLGMYKALVSGVGVHLQGARRLLDRRTRRAGLSDGARP